MSVEGIITLDWETYYDRDYSLTKMTTEEYIRDERFEIIGVSLSINDDEPVWVTGESEFIKARLHQLPWDKLGMLCHNTMFDAAICNWHLGIRPKALFDTLSMARPIVGAGESVSLANLAKRFGVGEKGDEVLRTIGMRRADFSRQAMREFGNYAKQDVRLTKRLFNKFLSMGFPMDELRLIDLTLRMFTEPVLRLDRASIDEHLSDLKLTKKQLLMDTMVAMDRKDLASRVAVEDEEAITDVQRLLRSDANFAGLLESLGVEPPTKISPRTGKEAYAFAKSDAAFKELEEHPDPRVQSLVAARVGVKTTMEESRSERFLDMSYRGAFPIPLRYCGAHTFRWSGCLVADTEVIVFNLKHGVQTKYIVDVLLDDLVWDGEEFVMHEGVSFSGYQEVMEWDGVTGTHDHIIYTDTEEKSLSDAAKTGERIQVARSPNEDDVDAARALARNHFT